MDALDQKLNATFDGKVLRKDLLHRIKKGTNVPTFVLEFLLAKYCASNEQAELDAGMEAVLSSLQENYVRPDEANAAQSRVATKGKHRFIDKVHVRYVEKEKRHWASLENFNSQRIAIGEKFYRDNDRLLEGGIWAEVTLAHNDIEDDDYAFSIEDLRPIQLTRFDFDRYTEGRAAFMRADSIWDTPRLAALAKFASTTLGKRFNAVGMMKVPTRKAQLDNELLDRIEGHFAGTQPPVPSIRPVYFCSELVTSAFIEAGIVEQSAAVVLAPETISPDDIGKDKVFGFFVGYLVSHPAYNVPAVDPFRTRI